MKTLSHSNNRLILLCFPIVVMHISTPTPIYPHAYKTHAFWINLNYILKYVMIMGLQKTVSQIFAQMLDAKTDE